LDQCDFKITRFTTDALNFGKGEKFDVDVPADLDQFGRDNSHGTVVGGKCLVKLRHHSPDGT
jgi:hypothetical protein